MAKRGQIVEEQAVEETARSIAQAQAVYEKLMNEIWIGYTELDNSLRV
ncbi:MULTISPECIES: hypothetical protein [Brevibacillus]|nr:MULTISPECIES: hypothetical protein [Brevibacillus]MDH6353516.1 hypothetical protein [Brevibacillus sp. 1238]MDR5000191.1 hypothetical protein [Brevibacillus parabrevis]UED70148.1 hypothetical protein HP435_05830 [Brevibacillus sp. HD3.3A]